MIMSIIFTIWPILEARAEIQKYFLSFFGSNEDIQKSFWNYLTFRDHTVTHMGDIPRFFFLFSIPFFSIYSIPFFSPICWSERLDILLRLNASLVAIATPHVVLSTMIQCNRGKFISTINEALGKPHYLYV